MDLILDLLNGKKTYIVSGLALAAVGLWMFGVIDQETAEKILATLGFAGVITLRQAVAKASR